MRVGIFPHSRLVDCHCQGPIITFNIVRIIFINLNAIVTDEALEQMRSHLTVTDDDFNIAIEEERRRRHDVMGHVHAYGIVAPAAAGIIHAGV